MCHWKQAKCGYWELCGDFDPDTLEFIECDKARAARAANVKAADEKARKGKTVNEKAAEEKSTSEAAANKNTTKNKDLVNKQTRTEVSKEEERRKKYKPECLEEDEIVEGEEDYHLCEGHR